MEALKQSLKKFVTLNQNNSFLNLRTNDLMQTNKPLPSK